MYSLEARIPFIPLPFPSYQSSLRHTWLIWQNGARSPLYPSRRPPLCCMPLPLRPLNINPIHSEWPHMNVLIPSPNVKPIRHWMNWYEEADPVLLPQILNEWNLKIMYLVCYSTMRCSALKVAFHCNIFRNSYQSWVCWGPLTLSWLESCTEFTLFHCSVC